MSDLKITAEGRNALRKAIGAHPKWDEFRRVNDLSFATMNRATYLETCHRLGLNAGEILSGAAKAERVEKAREAADAFADTPAPAPIVQVGDELTVRAQEVGRELAKDWTGRKRDAARDEADDASAWDDSINAGNGSVAERLMGAIMEIAGKSVSARDVRAMIRHELDGFRNEISHIERIEITRDGDKVGEVGGHMHPKFRTLLKAATARDANGYAPNIWIAGPAGSGKTKAVSMVADAFECDFQLNGAIGMPHELLGFTDAAGNYHRTPFRIAYETGCVYLFDEVDGSDNSALLALNAALANNRATFPDKSISRHEDCRIFAAANTWGGGATAEYVGRAKLDAAFLDRFAVKMHFDYDAELEIAISGNADFARRVQRARARANSAGLKVLISPRSTIAGAALIRAGFSIDDAAEMTYLSTLDANQRRTVEG